jgi:hypothetical protein
MMMRQHGDLLDRLQRQLYLNPPQRERIEQILRENHDHMKQLWDSIAPQAQEEHRRVHDLIRNELNADQQQKFEEMTKWRSSSRFGEEWRRRDDHRSQKGPSRTNGTLERTPALTNAAPSAQ